MIYLFKLYILKGSTPFKKIKNLMNKFHHDTILHFARDEHHCRSK